LPIYKTKTISAFWNIIEVEQVFR